MFFIRQQLHEEWLEREKLAQEEFRLKYEREEAARKRKEDDEVICHLHLTGKVVQWLNNNPT